MSKRISFLLIGILLIALSISAISKSNSLKLKKTLNSEKCSKEIEELQLCVENSKTAVNSGEQVKIEAFWVNKSYAGRRIGTHSSGYSVIIIDEKGEKLIPVFKQRQMEREKRINISGNSTMTEEDINELRRTMRGGSDRGIYAEANEIEKDEIRLTEIMYDYDLTARGIYSVTISKKVPSLDKENTIEFVVDNIEIEVR